MFPFQPYSLFTLTMSRNKMYNAAIHIYTINRVRDAKPLPRCCFNIKSSQLFQVRLVVHVRAFYPRNLTESSPGSPISGRSGGAPS